jgi:hypothetical protein
MGTVGLQRRIYGGATEDMKEIISRRLVGD